MHSKFYFDYTIIPRTGDDAIPFRQVQQFVFRKLHGIFSHHGNGLLALAFPNYSTQSLGDIFRILAPEKGLVDAVALELFMDSRLRACGQLGPSQCVGEPISWVCFKRVRPFSKVSFSKRGVFPELRERQTAKVRACPSISISSRTNGSPVILAVSREEVDDPDFGGTPDGYGLSRLKQVVPIPCF